MDEDENFSLNFSTEFVNSNPSQSSSLKSISVIFSTPVNFYFKALFYLKAILFITKDGHLHSDWATFSANFAIYLALFCNLISLISNRALLFRDRSIYHWSNLNFNFNNFQTETGH